MSSDSDGLGEDQTGVDRIKTLQDALQLEVGECDADTRPYVPHLSIGQTKGTKGIVALEEEIQSEMTSYCQIADWALDWLVDKVVVIEREGYDPFRVVGEVLLNEINE